MADYSRYKTETLEKMRDKAFNKYYELTTDSGFSNLGWGAGMRLSKLPQDKEWEKAKERLDVIDKELEKRKEKNKDEEEEDCL